jgi:DNA-binding NarL/FixJ family response regulator
MTVAVVSLPRPAINQSSVIAKPVEKICCPRCEYQFKNAVRVEVVERVIDRQPLSVEQVLRTFNLRPKELAVAICLAEGMKIRDIALAVDITEGVVKQYLRHVYLKSGAHGRQMFRMKIDRMRFTQ